MSAQQPAVIEPMGVISPSGIIEQQPVSSSHSLPLLPLQLLFLQQCSHHPPETLIVVKSDLTSKLFLYIILID